MKRKKLATIRIIPTEEMGGSIDGGYHVPFGTIYVEGHEDPRKNGSYDYYSRDEKNEILEELRPNTAATAFTTIEYLEA